MTFNYVNAYKQKGTAKEETVRNQAMNYSLNKFFPVLCWTVAVEHLKVISVVLRVQNMSERRCRKGRRETLSQCAFIRTKNDQNFSKVLVPQRRFSYICVSTGSG